MAAETWFCVTLIFSMDVLIVLLFPIAATIGTHASLTFRKVVEEKIF